MSPSLYAPVPPTGPCSRGGRLALRRAPGSSQRQVAAARVGAGGRQGPCGNAAPALSAADVPADITGRDAKFSIEEAPAFDTIFHTKDVAQSTPIGLPKLIVAPPIRHLSSICAGQAARQEKDDGGEKCKNSDVGRHVFGRFPGDMEDDRADELNMADAARPTPASTKVFTTPFGIEEAPAFDPIFHIEDAAEFTPIGLPMLACAPPIRRLSSIRAGQAKLDATLIEEAARPEKDVEGAKRRNSNVGRHASGRFPEEMEDDRADELDMADVARPTPASTKVFTTPFGIQEAPAFDPIFYIEDEAKFTPIDLPKLVCAPSIRHLSSIRAGQANLDATLLEEAARHEKDNEGAKCRNSNVGRHASGRFPDGMEDDCADELNMADAARPTPASTKVFTTPCRFKVPLATAALADAPSQALLRGRAAGRARAAAPLTGAPRAAPASPRRPCGAIPGFKRPMHFFPSAADLDRHAAAAPCAAGRAP